MSYQEEMYWYGVEREEKGKIEGTITTFFECGKTIEEIVSRLMQRFSLSREKTEEYVNQFKPV